MEYPVYLLTTALSNQMAVFVLDIPDQILWLKSIGNNAVEIR